MDNHATEEAMPSPAVAGATVLTLPVRQAILAVVSVGLLYGLGAGIGARLQLGAGAPLGTYSIRPMAVAVAFWLVAAGFAVVTARHPARRNTHWLGALMIGGGNGPVIILQGIESLGRPRAIVAILTAIGFGLVMSLIFFFALEKQRQAKNTKDVPLPGDDLYDRGLDGHC